MKSGTTHSGFDIYYRSNLPRTQKRAAKKHHTVSAAHRKKASTTKYVEIKDDEMAEPSVTPVDTQRIWI